MRGALYDLMRREFFGWRAMAWRLLISLETQREGAPVMRTRTMLLSVAALTLLAAANGYSQSSDEQPPVPHAHYARDGFWHCDEGYVTGESGTCEAAPSVPRSTYTRLREVERADHAHDLREAQMVRDTVSVGE
jgi:hypothetical protein